MKTEDAIKFYKNLVTWDSKNPKQELGGQSCGVIYQGATLNCDELGFSVHVSDSRSTIKNRQMCVFLFEQYIIKVCK